MCVINLKKAKQLRIFSEQKMTLNGFIYLLLLIENIGKLQLPNFALPIFFLLGDFMTSFMSYLGVVPKCRCVLVLTKYT
jgi:hypothetical protein